MIGFVINHNIKYVKNKENRKIIKIDFDKLIIK